MERKETGRYKRFKIYVGSLGAAALVGLGAGLVDQSASPAHADPSLSARSYDLLDKTRVEEYGLPPLPRPTILEIIAKHRVEQISAEGGFSHRDQDGNKVLPSLFSLYGENADLTRAEVLGQVSQAGRQAPEFIIDMFKKSCRHRVIILWPDAEGVGIGMVIANDGTAFMAVILTGNGSPADCP